MVNIKTNFIMSFAYEFIVCVYPLIMLPYTSRVLGSEGIGIYSYHYAIASYFALFCIWGINMYGNRSISRCLGNRSQMEKVFSEIYSAQIYLSILTIVVYLCYCCYLSGEGRSYSLILVSLLLSQALNPGWFFMGIGEVKVVLTRNLLVRIISAVLIFTFVRSRSDLMLYFVINGVTLLLGTMTTLVQIRKYITPSLTMVKRAAPRFLPIIKLFLPVFALNGYAYIDRILIGLFRDNSSVGLYENADKIVSMPKQVYTAMAGVLVSYTSSLIAEKKERKNNALINKTIDYILLIMIPVAFGISCIAPLLVPWYMGAEFEGCIALLKIFPFVLIFMGISSVLRTQYFIPNQKDNVYVLITVAGVVLNICISLLLIRTYGALGAVIGSLVSEFLMALAYNLVVNKIFSVFRAYRNIWIYFLSSLIMHRAINVIFRGNKSTVQTTILQIICGGFVYFLSVFLLCLLCKEKRIRMKTMVKKIRKDS